MGEDDGERDEPVNIVTTATIAAVLYILVVVMLVI